MIDPKPNYPIEGEGIEDIRDMQDITLGATEGELG